MTQLTNNTVSVTTEITDGQLTLGVELKNYQSNDCKFDHFTLEYLGGAESTGIEAVNAPTSPFGKANEAIFDLTGRRLSRPAKGLNIIGGQKVLVK